MLSSVINKSVKCLHDYYSKGVTKRIPMFSAISVVAFCLFMNAFAILQILGIDFPNFHNSFLENKILRLLFGFLLLVPFYVVVYVIYQLHNAKQQIKATENLKRCRVLVFTWFYLSLILLIALHFMVK